MDQVQPLWRRLVAQLYFHCSNTREVLIDRAGAAICDATDARDHAAHVVRSLVRTATAEDWRGWVLQVSDDRGEEIFAIPFASLLGRVH
jgi:hypothetical protein